jgi:alkanesulfonate monooxygenase SsuD/methylene tetrahydromethanopterin reductase-like flavin-dependent oxidoreductase (luciferase family)
MTSRLHVGRPKAEIKQNFKILTRGADSDMVRRILSAAIIGTPDECIKKLEAFANTKLNYIILMSNDTLKDVERFGKKVMSSFI